MYFLTKQDPDYTIKGSRDPLGFQVIWQEAGKKLIPYLSTVSGSVIDFQIICLAHYLKEEMDINDENFEPFFLCFEQLMAYTRFRRNPALGFNGIDRVRKVSEYGDRTFKIATHPAQQILSNQKAYGMWGKYIRPFRDMNFINHPEFRPVFGNKVQQNKAFLDQAAELLKKCKGQEVRVGFDRLENFYELLEKPQGAEKALLEEKLLVDNYQGELFQIFQQNGLPEYGFRKLYPLLDFLESHSDDPGCREVISEIRNIEKVLCPLNRIFRLLQTQSLWRKAEIESRAEISNWRTEVEASGFNQTLLELADLVRGSNQDLIRGLVRRNQLVSEKRGANPWIQEGASGLEVNHFEGGFIQHDFDPDLDFDNPYFLNTYTSLYRQLTY
jgi:hypothetical protein